MTKTMEMKPINNLGLWYHKTFFQEYQTEGKDLWRAYDKNRTGVTKTSYEAWMQKTVSPFLNAPRPYSEEIKTLLESHPHGFELTTTYPGLVCGLGYEHAIGAENEFQLGFSFDYTTGQPYIPGSSVKGVLRSAFRHPDYIKSIFQKWQNNLNGENPSPKGITDKYILGKIIDNTNWKKFEQHIFDGADYQKGSPLGKYKRDVFRDAFIQKSLNKDNLILADDYITCHQNNKMPEMTPFADPNPVRFLKVRSKVVFYFPFRLADCKITDEITITASLKEELFQQILVDLGVGAKTNVGYGHLQPHP